MNIETIKFYLDNNYIPNGIFNNQIVVYKYYNDYTTQNVMKIYKSNGSIIFEYINNKTVIINDVFDYIVPKLNNTRYCVWESNSNFCLAKDGKRYDFSRSEDLKKLYIKII